MGGMIVLMHWWQNGYMIRWIIRTYWEWNFMLKLDMNLLGSNIHISSHWKDVSKAPRSTHRQRQTHHIWLRYAKATQGSLEISTHLSMSSSPGKWWQTFSLDHTIASRHPDPLRWHNSFRFRASWQGRAGQEYNSFLYQNSTALLAVISNAIHGILKDKWYRQLARLAHRLQYSIPCRWS